MTNYEKEIIENLEVYLQEELWRYTEPPLDKEECELFLKLLKQKDKRPKGKWEKFTCMDFVRSEEILKCNKCDWLNGDNFAYNYCPNCGAKMIGEE